MNIKKIGLYLLAGIGVLAVLASVVKAPLFISTLFTARNIRSTYPALETGLTGDQDLGMREAASYGQEKTLSPDQEMAGEGELTERKIVKNGSLSLLVKKAEGAAEKIKEAAERAGGYTQYFNIYEVEEGVKRGRVTVRVPAESFDGVMDEIKGMAVKVEEENENTSDVTERYLDLEARLKNRKAEEEQYMEIMDRADDVEDILNVASRLSDVREKIERLEAQIDYLSKQVNMSTISVNLTSEAEVEVLGVRWRPLYTVKKSIKGLVKGFANYVDKMIAFFFALPILALWALTIGVIAFVVVKILKFGWKFIKGKNN